MRGPNRGGGCPREMRGITSSTRIRRTPGRTSSWDPAGSRIKDSVYRSMFGIRIRPSPSPGRSTWPPIRTRPSSWCCKRSFPSRNRGTSQGPPFSTTGCFPRKQGIASGRRSRTCRTSLPRNCPSIPRSTGSRISCNRCSRQPNLHAPIYS